MESCNHQYIKSQIELLLVVLQNYHGQTNLYALLYEEQAGVQRRPLTITPSGISNNAHLWCVRWLSFKERTLMTISWPVGRASQRRYSTLQRLRRPLKRSAPARAIIYRLFNKQSTSTLHAQCFNINAFSLLCCMIPASLPLSMQVYPSSNPLDQKDFSPIDYINELFPSEQVNPLSATPRPHPPTTCFVKPNVYTVLQKVLQSTQTSVCICKQHGVNF